MQEIVRISLTDTVADMLKKSIESGEFAPGDKLPPETKLCEELKVSRTCIREAIRVLQAMGYVEIKHGKGAFVLNRSKGASFSYDALDLNELNILMEIRNSVEVIAVEIAAKQATKRQISMLESIHESFTDACNNHDVVRMIMIDELFHSKIASLSQNQLIISLNKLVLEAYRSYRGNSFNNEELYQNAILPHKRILSYIKMNDPEGAASAMQEHLQITKSDMKEVILRSQE